MFVCVHEAMQPGVFRPDGSPPGTIHSLIHTVDKSVYKGSIHRRINVSETAPRRPSQSLELCQRTMVTPCSLTAYTGLYQAPQDGMSEQCAKPALARFVTLFRGYCRMAVPRCQARLSRGHASVPSDQGKQTGVVPRLGGGTASTTRGTTGGGIACFPFCYATLPTLRSLEVAGGGVGIKGHKRGWLSRTQSVLLRSA